MNIIKGLVSIGERMSNHTVSKLLLLVVPSLLLSHHAQAQNADGSSLSMKEWFGILELPFLAVCLFFALRTATALKGGVFGNGMTLLAWSFLVMAIGHLHMQLDHFFNFNLFNYLFGSVIGSKIWFIALVITWALSGLGFYRIHQASKVQ